MQKEIKVGLYPEKDGEIVISEASITYTQKCDQKSGDSQELKISIDDSGSGSYLVFETERWAIENIEELADVLNDFKNRIPL